MDNLQVDVPTLVVTADNGLGVLQMATYALEVSSVVEYSIYLPLVLRNN